MKKHTLKISLLALLMAVTLVLSASCSLIFPNESCTHENVGRGTCVAPGKCTACGEAVGELGDHVYRGEVTYPDCVNGGFTKHTCEACGDFYKDAFTDPVGHNFGDWIFTKDPTDTEDGEMYRECSVCHIRETDTVPAHVHTLTDGAAQPVTCTADGWDAYEYCTQCKFTTRVIIKATGHSWGAYTSNGDSTHTRVCQNDPSHVATDPCSGGDVSGSELPTCDFCHSKYDFAVREGNSSYGYHALGSYATYGKGMQSLYKDMTRACEQFYTSEEDLVLGKEGYYIIGRFELGNYSLNLDAGSAVWKVFYVSSPVYYWLDAKIVTIGDTLLLTVADDYARAIDRRAADTAISAMTAECDLLIKDGMTDLEKAVTITAYIVENMEYAYKSDGETPEDDMWAHCMAGFAMRGYGVCEAYAKSFMYLCLLNGVDCRMGSGYAGGEAHAWNYVKLGSEWYGADITWTDNSGSRAVYDKFGLSGASIFADHTQHSSTVLGGDFMYAPPSLSAKDIELTALYKNGDYIGLYKSIDEAFAVMNDANAEYEIKIGYYGFFVGSPTHTVKAAVTPSVKKLTITGRNEYVGEGNLDNNSIITFSSQIKLGSDVEMKNLHLLVNDGVGPCAIDLAGHTLTLGGDSVYMDNRVVGSAVTSALVVATTDIAYVYGGVDIYRLVTGEVGILLGADSTVQMCRGNKIYVPHASDPADRVNIDIVMYI